MTVCVSFVYIVCIYLVCVEGGAPSVIVLLYFLSLYLCVSLSLCALVSLSLSLCVFVSFWSLCLCVFVLFVSWSLCIFVCRCLCLFVSLWCLWMVYLAHTRARYCPVGLNITNAYSFYSVFAVIRQHFRCKSNTRSQSLIFNETAPDFACWLYRFMRCDKSC